MRIFSIVAVSVLVALSLGATCVTSVEQKGPEGPWVGEVVNTSDQVVNDVFAHAQVTDATGSSSFTGLGSNIGHTCPSVLGPGERGAFEMTVSGESWQRKPKLPLKATFDEVAFDRPGRGGLKREGLVVRYLSKDDEASTVTAELRNEGTILCAVSEACVVLRDVDGKVVGLGKSSEISLPHGPLASFAPGDRETLTWSFREMPEGTFEFFAMGVDISPQPPCCMP